ncbi:alkylation response protein AidB-like acyl-CoA dehydrogenase [Sphingopyxis panaciterrae]|uniref:acyl-CoA dehydrogenase family protein n=1 Tax=Sphingopyxis panaciterrae TaxID=363841 RepID=UPI0014211780|nr:acyl-CoA dehydrogenase family protein [Sphingopyxis panaciterrae]NIJ35957.1 alkylation response protein AidB-like acyl-CoA dehydrogenase [Sphingopyxis panaciterrae]
MQLSPDDEAFRDEVRTFFAAELTPELRRAGKLMTSVYADHDSQMAWQEKLHAKGWAAPAWPVEHGGCDWSVVQHHIFASERVRAGAPPVSPMGIRMCGPAIIGFGTDEQKAYFLPRMLNGEHFWCQGYSEPGAGSDLAALQMKAVRDGDYLVCTGTKIWTTHANVANWIFCLVRTAKSERKQQGITFLLIDMTSPGIEVRPIIMASGEHIQNQIFFDNVRVPVANVLGTIDNGWTVAKYLLEFERGGSAYAPEIEVALDELAGQVAVQSEGPGRALLDARIAEARIRCDILARLESDILSRLSAGAPAGTDASMMKILGTELQQRVTELALEAAGPLARALQPGVAMPGGPIPGHESDDYCSGEIWQAIAPLRYLNERAGSIYAGTNEIQRNILAKAELGI